MTRRIPPAQSLSVAERTTPLHTRGLVQLLASVLFLASGWPLTKLAIDQGATPLWFAEGRVAMSGIIAAVLLLSRGGLRLPARGDLPAVVAVGVFQLGAFFALTHMALAWVAAGRTAVLANTTTIFVVPLSLIVLRERIDGVRWMATALGLAGIVVLIGPWAIDWGSREALIGNFFLLAAAFSWTIAIVTLRRQPPKASMFELLPWCFLVGALVMLPLVLREAPHGSLGTTAVSWESLAYVGLVAGPLGTWGAMEATTILPATVSSIGFLAIPAVGIMLSNWILGEKITLDLVVGTALILGGIAIAAVAGRRRG